MADPKMFVLEIELGSDLFYIDIDGVELFAPEMGVADMLRQAATTIEIHGVQARYLKHVQTGEPIGSYGYKVEEVSQ